MPVFKQRVVFELARGLRAFMNLEAGLVRDQAPNRELLAFRNQSLSQKLEHTQRWSKERDAQLKRAHQQIADKNRELAKLRTKIIGSNSSPQARNITPDRLVWIFGTARTGSTWLSWMMGELKGHTVWFEPHVGELFGRLYYDWNEERHFQTKHFILGVHKGLWLGPIRRFVLDAATKRFPEAVKGGYLIVKEPNGSIGAPLLTEALPESRMILLMRDPRDVVASALDTFREGSWHYEYTSQSKRDRKAVFGGQPDEIVRERAYAYLQEVTNSRQAYNSCKGHKMLVKYEDLRADTLGSMKRIYSELKIAVDEGELARAVDKHSWENVPEAKKGEGKFHRKASPGGWREDLTTEQVSLVEEVTAPILNEFYLD